MDGGDLRAIPRLEVLEHTRELRAQLADLAVEHQAARGVEAVQIALDRALLDLGSERALDHVVLEELARELADARAVELRGRGQRRDCGDEQGQGGEESAQVHGAIIGRRSPILFSSNSSEEGRGAREP